MNPLRTLQWFFPYRRPTTEDVEKQEATIGLKPLDSQNEPAHDPMILDEPILETIADNEEEDDTMVGSVDLGTVSSRRTKSRARRPVELFKYEDPRFNNIEQQEQALEGFTNLENLPWPIVDDLPPGDMDLRSKLERIPPYVYLSDHLVGLIMSALANGDCPFFADAASARWEPDFVFKPEGLRVRKRNRRARGRGWTGEAIHGANLKGDSTWRDMHKTGAPTQWSAAREARPATKRTRPVCDSGDETIRKRVRIADGDIEEGEPSLARPAHGVAPFQHQDLEAWYNEGWSSIGHAGALLSFDNSLKHLDKALTSALEELARRPSRTFVGILGPNVEIFDWAFTG